MKKLFVTAWIVILALNESWACRYSGAAMFHWTRCNTEGAYVNTTSCSGYDYPLVYCQHPAPANWPPAGTSPCEINGFPMAGLPSFLNCPVGTDNLPAPEGHIPPNCPAIRSGSVISVDTQILSEIIPLVGVPFNLVYSSDRVEGMKAWTKVKLPLTHSQFTNNNATFTGFEIKTEVDGTTNTQFASHSAGLSIDFTRPALSQANNVNLSVTYKYTDNCGPIEDLLGASPPPNPVCNYYEAHLDYRLPISYPKISQHSFNGWTISIHHSYDSDRGYLMMGDGSITKLPKITKSGGTYWVLSPNQDEVFIFDASDNHIETKDSLLGTTKYTLNYSSSKLVSVVDAYNNQTTFQYSGNLLTSITSPYNQVTLINMDTNGDILSVTNPANEMYEMTYYTASLLETFTDPSGVVTTMTYDADGKLISDISSAGRSTSLSKIFNDAGFNVTETSALGRKTRHEVSTISNQYYRTTVAPDNSRTYYHQKSPTETVLSDETNYSKTTRLKHDARFGNGFYTPDTVITQAGYKLRTETFLQTPTLNTPNDPFSVSQLLKEHRINGKLYSSVYTSSTGTEITTTPEGRTSNVVSDINGRLTSIQKGSLVPVSVSYDTRGRVSTISQGISRVSTLSYDTAGNLLSIENPAQEVVSFGYDLAGRMTSQTLPDSRVIAFTYDSRGNLTSVTPPGKPSHNFQYNNLGHASSYIPPTIAAPSSTTTTYTYNNDDQLTHITRPGSQVVEFTYDPTYRNLTSITLPNYAYRYFSYYKGYLSQTSSEDYISTSVGVTEGMIVSNQIISSPLWQYIGYSYNNEQKLASETFVGEQVNFSYDNDSLMISAGDLSYMRSATSGLIIESTLGSINHDYSYSNFGELSSIAADKSGVNVYSESMTRDSLGRIVTRTELYGLSGSNSYEYTYDSTGRLIDVEINGSSHSQYSYDSNSNRTSQVINGQSVTGITYDDQDRLTHFGSKSFSYSLNGDLNSITDSATSSTTSYVYDVFGNLKSVVLPSKTINYGVDAFNRRVIKKNGSSVVNYYVWNKDNQLIGVMDQNGLIQARFIYGEKSHVPEYMIQGTDKYKIVTNHLGSPVVVINSATGTIAQEVTYDEFGNILTDSSPGFTPFGFAGCLYDVETMLCRFGARDYDPSIGRWFSKDPILFAGGDANLYGYVFNDPINYIDPNGKFAILPVLGIIGSVGVANAFGSALGTFAAGGNASDAWSSAKSGFMSGALTGASALGALYFGIPGGAAAILTGVVTNVATSLTDATDILGRDLPQGHMNFAQKACQ